MLALRLELQVAWVRRVLDALEHACALLVERGRALVAREHALGGKS